MPIIETVKVFDPANLFVSWGPVLFKGWAAGTKLTLTPQSDDTSDESGGDGEVTVIKLNDTRVTVVCTLSQMSDTNTQLTNYRRIGRKSPNMAGAIFPFTVEDLNGNALYEAPHAWIMKMVERTFADTPQAMQWTFRCAHMDESGGSFGGF